ncbi:hypothetical protein [Pedobacter rhizosphaerae]|uniref:Uncharacterized protein n=1 Tax=Pedobacter rhizosphaerae TaxID=390241 RepID=A0A1H9M6L7_9SPHI|nr:hypothetical protein [Pedobacter rhizosphaerae]SER19211.1 hypothetical protein SAMN04488023_105122 [Pedobacter rhizosphaerae]
MTENQTNSLCNCCARPFNFNDIFCNSCGYPLNGTEQEQKNHISNRAIKEIDLVEFKQSIEKARTSLYWIAAIIGLSAIFEAVTAESEEILFASLVVNVILIGAFLAFAVIGKTKPTTALIAGLSVYVIIILLNAILEPSTLVRGIIFKVIIIGYLVKGLKAVLEADKLKKELNIN